MTPSLSFVKEPLSDPSNSVRQLLEELISQAGCMMAIEIQQSMGGKVRELFEYKSREVLVNNLKGEILRQFVALTAGNAELAARSRKLEADVKGLSFIIDALGHASGGLGESLANVPV